MLYLIWLRTCATYKSFPQYIKVSFIIYILLLRVLSWYQDKVVWCIIKFNISFNISFIYKQSHWLVKLEKQILSYIFKLPFSWPILFLTLSGTLLYLAIKKVNVEETYFYSESNFPIHVEYERYLKWHYLQSPKNGNTQKFL